MPEFGPPVRQFAEHLFDDLRASTADGAGVTRESFGAGEQAAVDLCAARAASLGLQTRCDAGGNLHMTLAGRNPDLPGWITGSHLDSVPQGGNFDGAAGVVAGLTVLAAWRQAGSLPERSITVIGIRGEEASSWYRGHHDGHLGSRAALGLLTAQELTTAINIRSGAPLREHLARIGLDPEGIAAGRSKLDAAGHRGFVELHIEQGPVLEALDRPVGVVSGIRGSARARAARCVGAYTHSGAVPHEYRQDAVLATAELCHRLDHVWEQVRAHGRDLVFTVGKLYTNPDAHSISKVPGEVSFSIDFRSLDLDVLHELMAASRALAEEIGARRKVRFELGEFNVSAPVVTDAVLRNLIAQGARELDIAAHPIASGAGHDAQEFSRAGFPTAMIFVRNANGSHNPQEAMRIDDFMRGTQLLAWTLSH